MGGKAATRAVSVPAVARTWGCGWSPLQEMLPFARLLIGDEAGGAWKGKENRGYSAPYSGGDCLGDIGDDGTAEVV